SSPPSTSPNYKTNPCARAFLPRRPRRPPRCPPWPPGSITNPFSPAAPRPNGLRMSAPCSSSRKTTAAWGRKSSAPCAPAFTKEGKSFVAANLAQVMVRQHGRRALLIDGDLRNPGMHRHLGATPSPGLADYLLGECDEFAAMQRGPMENLFFMPAGRIVGSAPELLSNGRLKLFLQRVEPLFDWIIMDTSPVIPVSDATLVAKFCDGILMV